MMKRLLLFAFLLFVQALFVPSVTAEVSLTGTVPHLLKIPSLSIEASIIGVTKEELNRLPHNGDTIFWYQDGVNPGGRGSAVLAGHFDDYEGPAIFYSLKDLTLGDMVYVVDKNKNILMFKVEEVTIYHRKQAPIDQVFMLNDGAYLQLITCDGYYSRKDLTHSHRLIVKAKRVGQSHFYEPIERQV